MAGGDSRTGSKPDMELKDGDIIIRVGFSAIQCDFYSERQVLLSEGKDLLSARHVFNCEEKKPKSGPVVITARCVRQMAKHHEPYFLTMTLDSNRNVVKGADKSRCSCQAGGTGGCF